MSPGCLPRIVLHRPRISLLLLCALLTVSLSAVSRVVCAQGRDRAPEFTRQGLLIVNFAPRVGGDLKLGRRAAGAVRSRVSGLVNRRDTDVIAGTLIDTRMARSGYVIDSTFSMETVRSIAQFMRADEYLSGWIGTAADGVMIGGELILLRDERLRQVIAPVSARTLDSAATLFARAVIQARTQLVPSRRCENALRAGEAAKALASAREGVTGYARSVIARTCYLWAQRATGVPADDVLQTAREILTIDSSSVHALEAAALALDTLNRREESADFWLRLAASDTSNLDLAVRVGYSLLDGGSIRRAQPFILRMVERFPADLRLQQLKWRSGYENRSWASAIEAAELMITRDSLTRADSAFVLRLGIAYQSNRQPYKAIETLARGVSTFPGDARLYSLYSQYVRSEADTVVPRGLALFPRSADLLALNAKDLRARGKVEESLRATKMAVSVDSSMKQGYLQIAQLELLMGRPDSALYALHRGLRAGEDTALVAQFALAEGNARYRGATASKALVDYQGALQFLLFADSVRTSPQSKFLSGASGLAIAQIQITASAQDADRESACRQVREGAALLPMSRVGLQAGSELYAEPARQSLEYLDKLDSYAQQQLRTVCSPPTR